MISAVTGFKFHFNIRGNTYRNKEDKRQEIKAYFWNPLGEKKSG